MIQAEKAGLFCARGDFYVDPAEPVRRAIITHAHADHATPGHEAVHCLESCAPLLEARIGGAERIVRHAPGESFELGAMRVSLHPAGHILGSAQVRVESPEGEVWVVSGDYKRQPDPTCAPFEVVPCDTFITESTFALPIYRFPSAEEVTAEILAWWKQNKEAGRASLLYCYTLGKVQRILAMLAAHTEEVVYAHGAHRALSELYASAGVRMLPLQIIDPEAKVPKKSWAGKLVLAPPSARRSTWLRRFGDHETAFASGWMRVRGTRRGRGLNRGFVLSDHADWAGLLRTIEDSKASRILCTHGNAESFARYLREIRDMDASVLKTAFRGEAGAEA